MSQNPVRIALWRFEQISHLVEERLTRGERSRLVNEMAKIPVVWPSGEEKPIDRSTLYRWIRAWQGNPRIESLMPRPRKPRQHPDKVIEDEWVQFVLALLEEEPARSLFILSQRIKLQFGVKAPARSSLHRALKDQPRYLELKRLDSGRSQRIRTRFQALKPHDIWHCDAKGPFPVLFADGAKTSFSVLSILDDVSRYILAALIVLSENTPAVVATFRQAAARWGLPKKWYADRHSVYDCRLFRRAMGLLGIRRVPTKGGNPEAHGKIEAYHRVLQRWFVNELKHQRVLDQLHLQQLLDAVLDQLYHEHPHKELRMTPRQAFAHSISQRRTPVEQLHDAFLIERQLRPHRKTAEVRVNQLSYRIPRQHLRPKVRLAVDPQLSTVVYLLLDSGKRILLEPAIRICDDDDSTAPRNEPVGSLTPILEAYRGRQLPLAHAGFGLPEIYKAFASAIGRFVPATQKEATTVSHWLARCGPFHPKDFQAALDKVLRRIGPHRPLTQILTELQQLVQSPGGTQ